jgi:hypothetical protein
MENHIILIAVMVDKDKTFSPEIVNSIGLIQQYFSGNGSKFEIIYTVNKNEAIAVFLENTLFTHILFLNSYTIIQSKDINKMIKDNVDLVCVAIPQKEYHLDLLFSDSMIKYIKKMTEERTKIIEKYTSKIKKETKETKEQDNEQDNKIIDQLTKTEDNKSKITELPEEKGKEKEEDNNNNNKENNKDPKKNEEIEKLNRYLIMNYVNMSSKLINYQVNLSEHSNLINDGLLQVKSACLDCSLIKKCAIVNIIKKHENLKINDKGIMKKYLPFYYDLFKDGDEAFCNRYNEIGGKIMVDTIIQTATLQNVKILSQFFASLKIKSEKENFIQ